MPSGALNPESPNPEPKKFVVVTMSVAGLPVPTDKSFHRGGDISKSRLFFIVGRSRSGTTLLQTMLDANPNLAVAPECQVVMNMYNKYRAARWNRKTILRFYRDVWLERRLKTWGLDKDKLLTDLLSLENRASFANSCKVIYRNYAETHRKGHVRILGDLNHHYCLFVHKLAHVFPEARFIHMVRDFRDNVLSHQRVTFEPNDVSALAYRWKAFNAQVLRHAGALGDRITRLRYEDLVTNPDTELARICDFLGVKFHADMLQHHKHGRPTFDDPWQQNLRNPVNTKRVEAWRKEMRPRDVVKCDLICAPLATQFGYHLADNSAKSFTPLLRMTTLPGVLYGWTRTILERLVFSMPIGVRSTVITISRTLNKSGPN
jgi:hypothetical protein